MATLMASIESGERISGLLERGSVQGWKVIGAYYKCYAGRSRLGRSCYCIIMPLSLMANDLSFPKKKKKTFWEISYLGLGKGK